VIVGIDGRIALATGRGWGRYTRELIDAVLATEQVELRILAPQGAEATAWASHLRANNRVQVDAVPFDPASPDDYQRASRGITIESRFDTLDLVHSPTRFVLATAIRPLAVTVHDIAPLSDPPFKSRYRAATIRAIEFIRRERPAVMTVSAFTRHELHARAGLDVGDVEVIHEGVSTVFHPDARTAIRPYVLYVGGAGKNKNLDRLLTAMEMVRERSPIDLLMAGDRSWDHQELRQALGSRPPRWIQLSGYVTDEELAELYRGAALCVVPSLHEGFGLPVLEALACGTPLACSSIPVFEEIAGDAAAYFDPHDPGAIAQAMTALLDDPARVATLRERGPARARPFTWSETARKTIAVYRRLRREQTTTASSR